MNVEHGTSKTQFCFTGGNNESKEWKEKERDLATGRNAMVPGPAQGSAIIFEPLPRAMIFSSISI
jgi:hypothetical protein